MNSAGVPLCDDENKVDDLAKHNIEIQAATESLADLVKNAKFLAREVETRNAVTRLEGRNASTIRFQLIGGLRDREGIRRIEPRITRMTRI